MSEDLLEVALCRECGAKSVPGGNVCWLCRARLEAPARAVVLPPATAQRWTWRMFNLSTLMVMVALCAVLFGVFWQWPGLGILLAIALTPVLVETFLDVVKREASSRPMTVSEKFSTFASRADIDPSRTPTPMTVWEKYLDFLATAGEMGGIIVVLEVVLGLAGFVAFFVKCLKGI